MKRCTDLTVGLAATLLTLPLMVFAALAIVCTSPGPVFFRQSRLGLNGAEFKIWKLRTMHIGAHEVRSEMDDLNEADGHLFKSSSDPRLTRVGRILRRWSIDEIPQLFNVLAGEMSLVGPRPLPTEDSNYVGSTRRRLSVKPGMTGLWQVSGRSTVGWDEMVRLDLEYIDNWSHAHDLMILTRTGRAVLRGHGAY